MEAGVERFGNARCGRNRAACPVHSRSIRRFHVRAQQAVAVHGLKLVEDPPIPVDGGDGAAAVKLSEKERTTLDEMKRRLTSDRMHDPETGAELGEAQPGANGLSG